MNGCKCGDVFRIYANGKRESGCVDDGGDAENTLLCCGESRLFGTPIDTQHFAPANTSIKGDRIPATHVYCCCYLDRQLSGNKDVEKKHSPNRRNFFPMRTDCVTDGVFLILKRGKAQQLKVSREKRHIHAGCIPKKYRFCLVGRSFDKLVP